MNYKQVIPLVGVLLDLGLEIADMIDQAENVDPVDKAALKDRIEAAKDRVLYWGNKGVTVEEPVTGVTEDGAPVVNPVSG